MPSLVAVLLFAGAVLAAGLAMHNVSAAASPEFVAGTEDIPLMPGLRSQESTLVVFDKPQGRIIEVEAKGAVSRAAVEKFYATSLPQLGWTADGRNAWRRESERLRLAFKGQDGDLRVAFSLSPR